MTDSDSSRVPGLAGMGGRRVGMAQLVRYCRVRVARGGFSLKLCGLKPGEPIVFGVDGKIGLSKLEETWTFMLVEQDGELRLSV